MLFTTKFFTGISKPHAKKVNTFSVSLSTSFCMFPFGHNLSLWYFRDIKMTIKAVSWNLETEKPTLKFNTCFLNACSTAKPAVVPFIALPIQQYVLQIWPQKNKAIKSKVKFTYYT